MTDKIEYTTDCVSIIPTAETIERNKALIRRAVEMCADWFIQNPEHFISKAKIIEQKNQAWEKEDQKLNPPQLAKYCDPKDKTGIWYPDETKTFRPRQEPSIFNPIHACYGGKFLTRQRPLTRQTERITRFSIPANKDDALLVYYSLLICLHDGTAIERGFPVPITKTIWSSPGGVANSWPEFVTRVYYPECMDDDRADFIETAIRHVKADLDEKSPLSENEKDNIVLNWKIPETKAMIIGEIKKEMGHTSTLAGAVDKVLNRFPKLEYPSVRAIRQEYTRRTKPKKR